MGSYENLPTYDIRNAYAAMDLTVRKNRAVLLYGQANFISNLSNNVAYELLPIK